MALHLHRSNRSERLVDALAGVLRRPARDPFVPDVIAVQSKGMERWLAFELSARLGMLANAQWPFPRHLLGRMLDAVLGEESEAAEAFSEQAMTLSLAALLPGRLAEPAFEPLARYLAHDRDGERRMQLAARLARAFDDYAVYRPELLLGFEAGEDGGYEGALIRALVARHGSGHQAARMQRLLRVLEQGTPPRGLDGERALPERVCVFGVASLPPSYLRALSALSERVETHLFVLAPCQQYFGDLAPRRGAAALTAPTGGVEDAAQDGHPLLASLGRLGRDLQWLLEEQGAYQERDDALFEDPGQGWLLHALQSDMLALRDRGGAGSDAEQLAIAKTDDSIAIHVCHGPMREVEVLHDQLVQLFEETSVKPHEVVVMMPDVERYAPLVEAVFGAEVGRARIPFSVADRRSRAALSVVHGLHAVLDAFRSRMGASTVLDLLAVPCLGARAGIAPEELDGLRALVEESGVRVGIDAQHRAELGLPETQHHTWRFGLDRLLLGLALEGRPESLYAALRPVEGGHGSEAELLGKLGAFCERLFGLRARVAAPQRLQAWAELLGELLGQLIAAGPESAAEHALVRDALAELVRDAERAGFDEPLALPSVRALLEQRLDARLPARGLLGAGVTFCQLVPMRSIPFQVVCLLGMNDGEFPRPSAPISFERGAEHGKPRAGDRSARDDDRHMFLEAILCARRKLLVSYVGRGLGDNRVCPPSVVVSELLDALDRGFFAEGSTQTDPEQRRAALLERVCVVHRLHAFSPRYFDASDPRLYSYSVQACEAARAVGATQKTAAALEVELRAPDEPLEDLDVEALVRWVCRPLSTFAEQRLGLYLREEPEPPPDREPLELDGLSRWQLASELLAMRLRGVASGPALAALAAGGGLPHGTHGALLLEELARSVEPLVARTLVARGGARLAPALVSIEHAGVRVRGVLHDLYPAARVVTTCSRAGARAEHDLFVRHVLLGCQLATHGGRMPATSAFVCKVAKEDEGDEADDATTIVLGPLADPKAALFGLLELLREARRSPLPFEHDCSWAFAQALAAKGDREAALRAARLRWEQKRELGSLEPHVERFFPSFDALIAPRALDFATLAERSFAAHLRCRGPA